jgi:hypothetical protein
MVADMIDLLDTPEELTLAIKQVASSQARCLLESSLQKR